MRSIPLPLGSAMSSLSSSSSSPSALTADGCLVVGTRTVSVVVFATINGRAAFIVLLLVAVVVVDFATTGFGRDALFLGAGSRLINPVPPRGFLPALEIVFDGIFEPPLILSSSESLSRVELPCVNAFCISKGNAEKIMACFFFGFPSSSRFCTDEEEDDDDDDDDDTGLDAVVEGGGGSFVVTMAGRCSPFVSSSSDA